VFFSSRGLPWNTHFLIIGMYSRLCIENLKAFFSVFLPYVDSVLSARMAVGPVLSVLRLHIFYAMMCIVLPSAGVV
jgi:hypothetical protein